MSEEQHRNLDKVEPYLLLGTLTLVRRTDSGICSPVRAGGAWSLITSALFALGLPVVLL